MVLEEFIVQIFCFVDDHLKLLTGPHPLRRRGFAPSLADSEVVTMEIVGEFLGVDTDKGIWTYFRRHWRGLFPKLGSRSNFSRQAANLWRCKIFLQQELARSLGAVDDSAHIIDGLPMPVCRFRRAKFSRLFRGEAAFGRCEAKRETFYGFRGHVTISPRGVVTGFTLTPANTDERGALWDLVGRLRPGLLLGDKGYISAPLREELIGGGIDLQTPLRSNMHETRPPWWLKTLNRVRRRIETVIGQLSERFHIEKVWARDLWHLTSRVARKLLSHTIAVFFNSAAGHEPLQLDKLVAA